ncbi:unnamed protein product [Darwinula stevensoni]|uniref:Cobalamin adenosyltransferase-like domain-containing protein n=1 Tax=Darwinula stevensoni TaxID=69355 RepID=A0A7R9FUL6_9CRUS|nr:unnamed protein product [Darwinula stevensoni]CAG0909902.1 unnamed protein product [Darwinula stevensoni]
MPVGVRQLLVQVQHQLFDFGGELAMPGHALLNIDALKALDLALQEYNARLPALQEFILPAGVRSVCLAHVCRTVARRAERSLVALVQTQPVRPELLQYLNRLSDLFFVLARTFSQEHEGAEVFWQSQRLAMQDNKK